MYVTLQSALALMSICDFAPWIHVAWKKPQMVEGLLEWKPFDAQGPLDKRFFTWFESHVRYWEDRAHVPIQLLTMDFQPDVGNQFPSW